MTMKDCQEHHSSLADAESMEQMDAVSHGEGSQSVKDENHRVENLQMGLKHFVLEFSTQERG